MAGARHNGQNYIFALLTGYRDPPAGITVRYVYARYMYITCMLREGYT